MPRYFSAISSGVAAAIGDSYVHFGAADVLVVQLQPQPRRQQHPQRRDHAHQPALLVGGLQHDHGQAGIGAVFRYHALDQRALLGFRAGRRVAANLPVAVNGTHRALGRGLVRAERENETRDGEESPGKSGHGYKPGRR